MVGQAEVAVNVPQQPGARERVRLVHLVADLGEVGAAAHQFAGDVIGVRAGARILKRAGVGRDRGEQAVRNALRDWPLGHFHQPEDEFPVGRFAGGNPVQVAEARVALVVVDVDEELAVGDAASDRAEAFEGGRVGGYRRSRTSCPAWASG